MHSDFSYRIERYQHKMTDHEKVISSYFLQNGQKASGCSIQETAKKLGVSIATISRFSKKLGYPNFQQMKIAATLGGEDYRNEHPLQELQKEDETFVIAKKSMNSKIHSLKMTTSMLSERHLEKAIELIRSSNTLHFFGLGGSSAIASIAHHKFLRMPIRSNFCIDFHMQIVQAIKLDENDCAIIISHSGYNRDILRITEILKKNQVKTIAITSNPVSALAEKSTVVLTSVAEEVSYQPEVISSLISQVAIIDTLFLAMAMKFPDLNLLKDIRSEIQKTREF